MNTTNKIRPQHLARKAYVYIRQSTTYQVSNNTESTVRQYALRDRLQELGWREDMIEVIDQDLGISGKSSENREGFQMLIAEVAIGRVGAIACLEASRLSRNSTDWARVVELCIMSDTLLIDTDGIYNPKDFNDSLILGIKGTISEAELHYLQERMRGGLLNKAQRGELKIFLPIGYEYDLDGNVIKTVNIQIQEAVDLLFDVFDEKKTANGVVKHFQDNRMLFPVRCRRRNHQNEIDWLPLNESRVISILHNEFYTGTYTFGRTQMQWTQSGRHPVSMPKDQWHAYIPGHHEAYITVEKFLQNQSILQENTVSFKGSDKKTPPREGEALLQGICFCGYCGHRMITIYSSNGNKTSFPHYTCKHAKIHGEPPYAQCQTIDARPVDAQISKIVIESINRETLERTLEIAENVARHNKEHLRYYVLQVEKATIEADNASCRYYQADSHNHLVLSQLEAAWNRALMNLKEAQEELEKQKKALETGTDAEQLETSITTILENFETVWNDEKLCSQDKKRIVRHIIKDVTLTKDPKTVTAKMQIVFQGGETKELVVDLPKRYCDKIRISEEVLQFIDTEAEEHTTMEIVQMLNEKGFTRECKRPFTYKNVFRIMTDYGILDMKARYLAKGWLTVQQVSEILGISIPALRYRVKNQKKPFPYEWKRVNDQGAILFKPTEELLSNIKHDE